jgi:hypothetical protein
MEIRVKELKKIEGWVGKPKGMLQILYERGFIDLQNVKKYRKDSKTQDLDADGKLKEELKPFILSHLLRSCPDFASEKSALQKLAEAISTDDYNVSIEFTPKYHCEIAGEGIEYSWGFIKKIYRRAPLMAKRQNFLFEVKKAIFEVTKTRVRRFSGRVRKYMLAYEIIREEPTAAEDNEVKTDANHCNHKEHIDATANDAYANDLSPQKKKKTKRKRDDVLSVKKEMNQIGMMERYDKIVSTQTQPTIEVDERQWLEQQIGCNVNIATQLETHSAHRNAMDTDTAYLDAEVELFASNRSLNAQ